MSGPRNPLDHVGPYRGPCGCCGGIDARHRIADAIVGNVAAEDDPAFAARTWGISRRAVDALVDSWPPGADPVIAWAGCAHCHAMQGRRCFTLTGHPTGPHAVRTRAALAAVEAVYADFRPRHAEGAPW